MKSACPVTNMSSTLLGPPLPYAAKPVQVKSDRTILAC